MCLDVRRVYHQPSVLSLYHSSFQCFILQHFSPSFVLPSCYSNRLWAHTYALVELGVVGEVILIVCSLVKHTSAGLEWETQVDVVV